MAARKGLTSKQQQFVAEYLIDLNASQAAIRAGYSARRASEIGWQLLQKTTVAEAIQEAMRRRAERIEITQDRVLQELATVGFSDITHYQMNNNGDVETVSHVPPAAMRAVSSIKKKIIHGKEGGTTFETEIRLWDKIGSLRLTAQHLGMLTDKVDVTLHKDTPDILILGGDKDAYIQALKAMAASNGSNGH